VPLVVPGWLLAASVGFAAAAAAPVDDAISLYRAKRYPEAREALRRLADAGPANPEVCYYLGMALLRGGSAAELEAAADWLGRAVKLEPANPSYLADYGDACLSLARLRDSLTMAVRGRDALERAVALDPGALATREGLARFYSEAPFPLGDDARALDQAEAIAGKNPRRGAAALAALGRTLEKKGDRARARSAYASALRFDPACSTASEALSRLRDAARK